MCIHSTKFHSEAARIIADNRPLYDVEVTAYQNSYRTSGGMYAEGRFYRTEAEALDEAGRSPWLRLITTHRVRTVFERPRSAGGRAAA